MSEQMTLRDSVEQQLRDMTSAKPGYLEQLVLDPKGVIEPIIRAALDDDGELDLSNTDINVHVTTPKSLDFVVVVGAGAEDESEVEGFAFKGIGNIGQLMVMAPPRFHAVDGAKISPCSGSDATCHTDTNKTDHCAGC